MSDTVRAVTAKCDPICNRQPTSHARTPCEPVFHQLIKGGAPVTARAMQPQPPRTHRAALCLDLEVFLQLGVHIELSKRRSNRCGRRGLLPARASTASPPHPF